MILKWRRVPKRLQKRIETLQKQCNAHDREAYETVTPEDYVRSSHLKTIYAKRIGKDLVSLLAVAFEDADTALIHAVTHPKYRRKGYFTELFEEAQKMLTTEGVHTIYFPAEKGHLADRIMSGASKWHYTYSECLMKRKKPKQTEEPENNSQPNRTLTCIRKSENADYVFHGFGADAMKTKPEFVCFARPYAEGYYLFGIEVEEGLRGQGIGTYFLTEIIKKLDAPLYLQVGTNNQAAFHLYQKLGFNITEELRYYRIQNQRFFDEQFMKQALVLAEKAKAAEDVPIGCVIVKDGTVIASGYNRRNAKHSVTEHAEMMAIREANEKAGDWRLDGCTLYVTLEPCPMCAGAIIQARIRRVVIGADNAKAGCAGSVMNILTESGFNHQAKVVKGVLEKECSACLTAFFKEMRAKKVFKDK